MEARFETFTVLLNHWRCICSQATKGILAELQKNFHMVVDVSMTLWFTLQQVKWDLAVLAKAEWVHITAKTDLTLFNIINPLWIKRPGLIYQCDINHITGYMKFYYICF